MNTENDFLKFANMNSIKFLQPDTNLISLHKIINLRKKIKNKDFYSIVGLVFLIQVSQAMFP